MRWRRRTGPLRLVVLENQPHGGNGRLDLVDPHGVIVQRLPVPGVQGVRKYAPLFIRGKVALDLEETGLKALSDEKWLQLVRNTIQLPDRAAPAR